MIIVRGAAVLAAAFVLASCASSPPSVPSASPSTAASIAAQSPTPAPTIRPTATAAATTVPAASPSPSPSIKPLADVFASKRTKVAWNKLTAAEQALYAQHPEFESIVPPWNLIDQNLADCGGVQVGDQRGACGSVRWQDYLLYRASGLDEAFSTTVLAYQWALGLGIDKTWLDGYVTELVKG